MRIRLQTYPPLGDITIVNHNKIPFRIVLDVPYRWRDEPWEAVLWHSTGGRDWCGTPLSQLDDITSPLSIHNSDPATTRLHFGADIYLHSKFQFTVKFRHGIQGTWVWAKEALGHEDGQVIELTMEHLSDNIKDVIPDLESSWKSTSLLSQAPRTRLWSIEHDIEAARNDKPSTQAIKVGTPWGSFVRWFAIVRQSAMWLGPRQGSSDFHLDKDAILGSFIGPSGRHLVFLAVSGLNHVNSVLRSLGGNILSAQGQNDGLSNGKVVILVSEGSSFEGCIASVMYHARRLIQPYFTEGSELAIESPLEDNVSHLSMEKWYDSLGYCTWNSLGQQLSESKILNALKMLKDDGVPVSTLIIDDNWQSVDHQQQSSRPGWVKFEADEQNFPGGLSQTTSKIRKLCPDIKNIMVWHTILGYWGGISPHGSLAQSYNTVELKQDDDSRITVISGEDVSRFYDDFYRFLVLSGVDGTKTDAQVMMDQWTSSSARRQLTDTYLSAWTVSSLRHMGLKTISCMSQFPHALFASQMPLNRSSMVVRNSDDYFPDIPASHTWHVWANAHNAIFTQYLNVVPDWDMFQTQHPFGGFHAAARCISGGPIYITDKPGHHDLKLINEITGKKPLGGSIILRPDVAGKSISAYVSYQGKSALKVGSYHGSWGTGSPLLGIFNMVTEPLVELVPLSAFSGVVPDTSYIIRSHQSSRVTSPLSINDSDPLITISLDGHGYDILSAFPVTTFAGRHFQHLTIANMGVLGKMTGCAAIVSNSIRLLTNGNVLIETQLKVLGTLGLYISELPSMNLLDDFMVMILDEPVPIETVSISKDNTRVLEIDTDAAWAAIPEGSRGWGNDLHVKIIFSS